MAEVADLVKRAGFMQDPAHSKTTGKFKELHKIPPFKYQKFNKKNDIQLVNCQAEVNDNYANP
jgi:hypothetical protein